MGRLIDVDELKSVLGMSDMCEECKQDPRKCENKRIYTRMDVCCMLDDSPTVNAVPVVHGKKLSQSPVDPESMICFKRCVYKCSRCGEFIAADWTYCPYCGAKMDGGENDE